LKANAKTKKMKTKQKEQKEQKKPEKEIVGTLEDRDCPVHGNLRARGRIFEGKVIKKFPKRITIEFERMVYVRKYERYSKSRTKIHARLPDCMEKDINIGDLIKIQECRPLSKIIHFVVIGKIKSAEELTK
jgi:small subunit ribosomal protein S17